MTASDLVPTTLASIAVDLDQRAGELRRDADRLAEEVVVFRPDKAATLARIRAEASALAVAAAAARVLMHLCEIPADLVVAPPTDLSPSGLERWVDAVQAAALSAPS